MLIINELIYNRSGFFKNAKKHVGFVFLMEKKKIKLFEFLKTGGAEIGNMVLLSIYSSLKRKNQCPSIRTFQHDTHHI